jgi:hypothetical protein
MLWSLEGIGSEPAAFEEVHIYHQRFTTPLQIYPELVENVDDSNLFLS